MKRHTKVLAGVLALSLLGAACGDDDDDAATDDDSAAADIPDGPTITLGAQDFGESNDRPSVANLLVYTGNEAGRGDRVTVLPSSRTNIFVNGGSPTRRNIAIWEIIAGTCSDLCQAVAKT